MSQQSRRNIGKIYYASLHSGKSNRKYHYSSSQEDVDDSSGECELLEDENDYLDMEADEDGEFLEEGEITDRSSKEEQLQELIQ